MDTSDRGADGRQTKRYGNHSKYGRNSVVIMSNAGWEDSEEALQDPSSRAKLANPNSIGGVLKTKEVRVHHERLSTMGEERIELDHLGPPYKEDGGRSSDSQASSYREGV